MTLSHHDRSQSQEKSTFTHADIARMRTLSVSQLQSIKPTQKTPILPINETFQIAKNNTMAQEIFNEQLDPVKLMNRVVMASTCDIIRKRQKSEKKEIQDQYKEYEISMDQMIEIERLKKVFKEQNIYRNHKKQVIHSREIQVQQMQQRQTDRIRQEEENLQDQQIMNKNFQLQKQQEEKIKTQQRNSAIQHAKQILESNKMQKIIAEAAKQMEVQEDQKILEYQQELAKREQDSLQDLMRQRKKKEKELTKMLELQERAADRQAEYDTLRAQMHFIAKEKLFHKTEAEKKLKHNILIHDLKQFREKQKIEKQQKNQQKIYEDQQQQQIYIQMHEDNIQDEKKNYLTARERQIKNKLEVLKQINQKEVYILNQKIKNLQQQDIHREKKEILAELQNHKNIISTVLKQESQGLDQAYVRDMMRYK